ncbi:hypothetical protein BB559_002827 [Furculomyces boomerangus]|uniref:Uncharacterized protein n=1 Tax=Furculomyces boomerangus TaxID=61424 RepID=A0A2T9YS39_9FUNG|nr:hypothetical protein BB559_002827 [Furculomyces boomerangus]
MNYPLNQSKAKSKNSPKHLRESRGPATPATKLMLLKLKGSTPLTTNRTNMGLGTSMQRDMDGSRNIMPNTDLMHNPYHLSKIDTPHQAEIILKATNSKRALKEDRLLSEAEQHILDLARIGINIKELSKSFRQIESPTQSKIRMLMEEINGSTQDTAVSVPETESAESQFLFHAKKIQQIEDTRQNSRNKRLLRINTNSRQKTRYSRSNFNHNSGYKSGYNQNNGNRNGLNSFKTASNFDQNSSLGFQTDYPRSLISAKKYQNLKKDLKLTKKIRKIKIIKKARDQKPKNLFNQLSKASRIRKRLRNTSKHSKQRKKPTKNNYFARRNKSSRPLIKKLRKIWYYNATKNDQQAQSMVNACQKSLVPSNTEVRIPDIIYPAAATNPKEGILTAKTPKQSHQCYGTEIFIVGNNKKSDRWQTAFVLPIFAKEEPNKIRPLLDLTQINKFVVKESFKMKESDPIKSAHQQKCADSYTRTRCLSSKLSIWAYNSTKNILQDHGIGIETNQENWDTIDLLYRRHSSIGNLERGMPETYNNSPKTPKNLGFTINKEKSITTPKQKAVGLNRLFSAAATAVGPSAIKSRELQLNITEELQKNRCQYNALCPLSLETIKDLRWWNNQMEKWNSSPIIMRLHNPNEYVHATTDASGTGWGITSQYMLLAGTWEIKIWRRVQITRKHGLYYMLSKIMQNYGEGEK